MAEVVQSFMEGMLPELEEYVKFGIFTREEVRSIIKKRSQFEYLIKRRAPELNDYLRYAQYEMNLNLLRKRRRSKLSLKSLKFATVSSYIPQQRIHFIFERALRRFKGDVGLWLQFIDWEVKNGSSKALTTTFAKAVQLHPTKPILWVKAAQWEFEANGSVESARVMLQRGLRVNGNSTLLWLAFFRTEIVYLEKLKHRTRVLGFMNPTSGPEDAIPSLNPFDSNLDVINFSLPNSTAAASGSRSSAELDREKLGGMLAGKDQFFGGAMPAVIYANAIRALPTDFQLRLRFMSLVPKLAIYDSLRRSISGSIMRDFSDRVECWQMLADQAVAQATEEHTPQPELQAIAIYEQALDSFASNLTTSCSTSSSIPSAVALFLHYARYLQLLIDRLTINTTDSDAEPDADISSSHSSSLQATRQTTAHVEFYVCRLQQLLQRAVLLHFESVELSELHVRTLLHAGDFTAALARLRTALVVFPESSRLLQLQLRLLSNRAAVFIGSTASPEFSAELDKEVARLSQYCFRQNLVDAMPLLIDLLDVLQQRVVFASTAIERRSATLTLDATFTECLSRLSALPASHTRAGQRIRSLYLTYQRATGVMAWRSAVDWLLRLPNPSLSLLQELLQSEASESSSADSNTTTTRIRILHERIVDAFGTERSDLWLQYIEFELQLGNAKQVQNLYQRAVKQVQDTASFMAKYNALK